MVPCGQLYLLLLHQGAFWHPAVLRSQPAEDVIRGASLEGLRAGAATRVLLYGAFLLWPPVELWPPEEEGKGELRTWHNDIYPPVYLFNVTSGKIRISYI